MNICTDTFLSHGYHIITMLIKKEVNIHRRRSKRTDSELRGIWSNNPSSNSYRECRDPDNITHTCSIFPQAGYKRAWCE